jgi:hypothetical protein
MGHHRDTRDTPRDTMGHQWDTPSDPSGSRNDAADGQWDTRTGYAAIRARVSCGRVRWRVSAPVCLRPGGVCLPGCPVSHVSQRHGTMGVARR